MGAAGLLGRHYVFHNTDVDVAEDVPNDKWTWPWHFGAMLEGLKLLTGICPSGHFTFTNHVLLYIGVFVCMLPHYTN